MAQADAQVNAASPSRGEGSMAPLSMDQSCNLRTKSFRGSGIASGQVSVASTATLVVAARTDRRSVIVTMLGNTDVFLGPSGVTTSTGGLLLGAKGTSVLIEGGAALYGIVTSTSQSVSFLESF